MIIKYLKLRRIKMSESTTTKPNSVMIKEARKVSDDLLKNQVKTLFPKELKSIIPNLYEQDGKGNKAVVFCKFFFPAGSWSWFVTEYNPEENLCFGFVNGDFPELGYFSMDELEALEIKGLKMERDFFFTPDTLENVKKDL